MTWVAVGVAGASLVSGAISSRNASRKQKDAARQAGIVAEQTKREALGYQQPYAQLGARGASEMDGRLNELTRRFTNDDFETDPGYQFRWNEGNRALTASRAARSGNVSGAAMKAAQGWGQGLASQEYQNAYNRFTGDQNSAYAKLMGLVGVGQGAANAQSGIVSNAGQMQTGAINAAGNAGAAGSIGMGNAVNQFAGTAANAYQFNQLLDSMNKNPGYNGGNFGSTNRPRQSGQFYANNYGYGGGSEG